MDSSSRIEGNESEPIRHLSGESHRSSSDKPIGGKSFERFYIPSLDGLRTVAVLSVFFSHISLINVSPGGVGVTIFFFLSGFLITTLMRLEAQKTGGIHLKNFYVRRAFRILPLMYLVLASATLCSLILGENFSTWRLVLQALHLTNYQMLNGVLELPHGTAPLWSLAVEQHFYLLFPLAFIGLRRSLPNANHQAIVVLLFCVLVLVWRCVLTIGFQVSAEYVMHATDCRIDSLLFGCVLAMWKNPALGEVHWSARIDAILFALASLVFVATVIPRNPVFRETIRYTLQGIALMPVFIAAIRYPKALPFRFLNHPIVTFIGVISYGIYLVHWPIILLVQRTLWPESVVAAVSLMLSILLATVLYYGVERPCAKLRRHFVS
jgi:peptidoglycan/LPS O-acetylase OafA/YrhL